MTQTELSAQEAYFLETGLENWGSLSPTEHKKWIDRAAICTSAGAKFLQPLPTDRLSNKHVCVGVAKGEALPFLAMFPDGVVLARFHRLNDACAYAAQQNQNGPVKP